jgi:hypothetical protein
MGRLHTTGALPIFLPRAMDRGLPAGSVLVELGVLECRRAVSTRSAAVTAGTHQVVAGSTPGCGKPTATQLSGPVALRARGVSGALHNLAVARAVSRPGGRAGSFGGIVRYSCRTSSRPGAARGRRAQWR